MTKLKLSLIVFLFSFIGLQTVLAQVWGCTDPLSTNYNSTATMNDGSCEYATTSISTESSFPLDDGITETSGLIHWNASLYTHNDNNDKKIFELDTIDGSLKSILPLSSLNTLDWEDISQDEEHIYIGDFGNNSNGNRTNLRIFKIAKSQMYDSNPLIETIQFSYSNQFGFSPTGGNNTDFDCEAFAVGVDSIYLFTKQWVSEKTSIYSLPKIAGTHIAQLKSSLDVKGLVTGAVLFESKALTVLCGYSSLLQPFVYLLYDYKDHNFVEGNKRKMGVSLSFHQVEGIASANARKFYISNEFFTQPPFITNPQKLHILDLNPYLGEYLNRIETNNDAPKAAIEAGVYPNPTQNNIHFTTDIMPVKYFVVNCFGQIVLRGHLSAEREISMEHLPKGVYFVNVLTDERLIFKVVKS